MHKRGLFAIFGIQGYSGGGEDHWVQLEVPGQKVCALKNFLEGAPRQQERCAQILAVSPIERNSNSLSKYSTTTDEKFRESTHPF